MSARIFVCVLHTRQIYTKQKWEHTSIRESGMIGTPVETLANLWNIQTVLAIDTIYPEHPLLLSEARLAS